MVVAFGPLTGTGYSGALGRTGIGIGSSWPAPLDLFLATSPSQVMLPIIVIVPSLGGIQAATMIRSLMFLSLVPSFQHVFPGFRPCSCSLAVVISLAPSPSKGSLLELELEL